MVTHESISHVSPVISDLICKVVCYIILIFHCGCLIFRNFVIWVSFQKIVATQKKVANDRCDK
jgi:hypothetical protein